MPRGRGSCIESHAKPPAALEGFDTVAEGEVKDLRLKVHSGKKKKDFTTFYFYGFK